MTEPCWRCGGELEWRHGTWQCPKCQWKLGCCEGEPQTACDTPLGLGVRGAAPPGRTDS